ncbi:MAG: uracil-DNA glycosylase [Euryarchaeota archaeon]|nr:uracil-DNA glycosylase [Euryarchaeota archaeon]
MTDDQSTDRSEALSHPTDSHVLTAGCSRCPALVESRNCISWGNGPLDATLLVVGEAPGAGDPDAEVWQGGNHTGCAYTSRHSGRRIRRLMADLGYAGDVYYTNAVNCFPEGDDGSNREPTPTERENCRPYLREEIDRVEPRVVVPTGKHATISVLAFEDRTVEGFLELVGEPIDCPTLGVTALPILHPSYEEVWRSRLGYDAASYREQIASHLP